MAKQAINYRVTADDLNAIRAAIRAMGQLRSQMVSNGPTEASLEAEKRLEATRDAILDAAALDLDGYVAASPLHIELDPEFLNMSSADQHTADRLIVATILEVGQTATIDSVSGALNRAIEEAGADCQFWPYKGGCHVALIRRNDERVVLIRLAADDAPNAETANAAEAGLFGDY